MRGFPPIQVAVVALLFLLGGIPVHQLTRGTPAAPAGPVTPAETAPSPDAVKALLSLRWAHMPGSLSVTLGDAILYEWQPGDKAPVEKDIALPASPDGWEVSVSCHWPEGTPETALTVTLAPDGDEEKEITRWSLDGAVEDVLYFSWP